MKSRILSLGRALKDERGSAVLMIMMMSFGFILSTFLVLDVGMFFVYRRHLQGAVDRAALAGALELPADPTNAVAAADEWLDRNQVSTTEPGTTTISVVITPTQIRVDATRHVPTIFSKHFGPGLDSISAHAIAEALPGGVPAIFVISQACSPPNPLQIGGSDNVVTGGVHSNGRAQVSGSNNDFVGPFTHQCQLHVGGSGNTFSPPAVQVGVLPSPINYTFGDFPCTVTFTSDRDLNSYPQAWLNNDKNTNQLMPGVYCSTRKLSLSGSNITGNVTLAALEGVNISGSDFTLTPYWNEILAFSNDPGGAALDVSGSGGSWTGILYAPRGKAKVAGSANFVLDGSIVAYNVDVSGSNFSLTGSDDGGEASIRLIE